MIFCLKNIMKRGTTKEPYSKLLLKEEEEESARTAREPEEMLQKTQSESDLDTHTALPTIQLVPARNMEQKELDEHYLLKAVGQAKKRRNDSSTVDDVSYPEEEDTLFGVRSLLTDNATSAVPRSITGQSSLPSAIVSE